MRLIKDRSLAAGVEECAHNLHEFKVLPWLNVINTAFYSAVHKINCVAHHCKKSRLLNYFKVLWGIILFSPKIALEIKLIVLNLCVQ